MSDHHHVQFHDHNMTCKDFPIFNHDKVIIHEFMELESSCYKQVSEFMSSVSIVLLCKETTVT